MIKFTNLRPYLDEYLRTFDPGERRIAKILEGEGRFVASLSDQTTVQNIRTPDALVDGVHVEIKIVSGGINALKRRLDHASTQGRRTIIDLSRSSIGAADAIAIARLFLDGTDLDYIGVIGLDFDSALGRWRS